LLETVFYTSSVQKGQLKVSLWWED
jgi:hypothetical protein